MPGLEAAACYTPVIATRCGGPEDYVSHGHSGFLVGVDDVEALSKAILDVVELDESAWRRMSAASYQNSLRFDWDRSAQILETTLLEAIRKGGVAR